MPKKPRVFYHNHRNQKTSGLRVKNAVKRYQIWQDQVKEGGPTRYLTKEIVKAVRKLKKYGIKPKA